jgi:hypothetical protein
LEIGPDTGFTYDIFNRKPFADRLTNIVRALDHPAVLLLDGEWGTGETTFVKMWLGELFKEGLAGIYFDAFANDYHDDAFMAIAGEIVGHAQKLKPQNEAVQCFKQTAIGVAKILGRASIRIAIRTASAGLLSGDEPFEAFKMPTETAKAVGDEAAKGVDELFTVLESHKADQEIFGQFKTALGKVANELSKSEGEGKSAEANVATAHHRALPLVFVIDELDRCRPSFALGLLEKIKHFYTVPGVVFVLVSSLGQLETAVRSAYGQSNALTYLEKFYHLRLLLPTRMIEPAPRGTSSYLMHLCAEFLPDDKQFVQRVVPIIEQINGVHPLSFRTLERIMTYLGIFLVSTPPAHLRLPHFVAGLSVMKVVAPELYAKARTGKLTFTEANSDLFRVGQWDDELDPQRVGRIREEFENWWRIALGEVTNQELADQYLRSLSQRYSPSPPSDLIPHFCDIIDGFSFPGPDRE